MNYINSCNEEKAQIMDTIFINELKSKMSPKFIRDFSDVWNSPEWLKTLENFEIKEKKRHRCLARKINGDQCSRFCCDPNTQFCGLHGPYPSPKVCIECSKFHQRAIFHTHKWEHKGRIDEQIPEHIESKQNINTKQCVAFVHRKDPQVLSFPPQISQCSHRASVVLGEEGWFCRRHAKKNYTGKMCARCNVVHEYQWECSGRVDQPETIGLNQPQCTIRRPYNFEKKIERRIDQIIENNKLKQQIACVEVDNKDENKSENFENIEDEYTDTDTDCEF